MWVTMAEPRDIVGMPAQAMFRLEVYDRELMRSRTHPVSQRGIALNDWRVCSLSVSLPARILSAAS